jgi:DNA polymerase III subunit gamma/tau
VSSEVSQPLTLKYRPRRFDDMVGQQAARVLLMQMIRTDKVPPALLLHGSWGSGKTTAARIVAAALNCELEDPEARPCGGCATCQAVVDGKSSDVTEIDAASSGGAEDMRELRQQVRYQPVGRYRVVLLDEAHELTTKGQQALLKVLEEPPSRVVFLLVTTNADRLLNTIASRCFSVQFRRITLNDLSDRLLYIAKAEDMPLSPDLALAIADRSQGAMRDAVMLLQQCALVGVSTPDQLSMLMGDSNVTLRLIEALAQGDYPRAFECSREGLESLPSPQDLVTRVVGSLTRLLVLTSTQRAAEAVPLAPPATGAEVALAAKLNAPALVSALRVVWEYSARIVPTTDAFAAMELLTVMLGQALSGGIATTVTPARTTRQDSTPTPKSPAGSSSPAENVDDILARAAARK